jgi:hypothetical protein
MIDPLDAAGRIASRLSATNEKKGLAQTASTRVRVSFHTDDDKGFDGVVDSNPDLGKNQPFRITGFTTTKRFGSNPGTFTINAKSHTGVDLLRLWRDPEDVWVRITVFKNGEPFDVMFGLMNTVTEVVDRGEDGTRSVTYQINGFDFQKVFLKTETFINIHEHAGDLPAITLYDAVGKGLIGRPNNIVKTLIDAWLGNEGVGDKQWRFPKSLGGRFFYDALVMDFDEDLRGKIFEPALLSPMTYQGQKLWQLLEEYSNGLLNELFTELDWEFSATQNFVRPHLVLRERPFPVKDDHKKWDALQTHYLGMQAIHRRQVSRGAPESRFNYWLIDGKGLLGNGLATLKMIQDAAAKGKGVPGSAPIYDIESIRQHGLRRWQNATRYLPFREDMDLLLHSASWLKIIHDWYSVAPYELSGTITTTELFPYIHIGRRLIEGRRDGNEVTYYIEGVTQNWNYPGPGSTTVNVTRGEYADEDLLEDIVYKRLTGEVQALDTMIEAATGLQAAANVLANNVPTGSGVQLDKMVGQVDTPERLYLKQQGFMQSNTAIKRGELTYQEDKVARVRSGDLRDQQLPRYAQPMTPRRKAGVLTQEELEAGVRLPVQEIGQHEVDRATLSEDDLAASTQTRTRTRQSRKR